MAKLKKPDQKTLALKQTGTLNPRPDAIVDPLFREADRSIYIAAGFIDIQVNGFAGVDYNSPDAAPDEIARSIVAVFSTGVTRFFPTVITGAPEKMLGALKNLAAARESLEHGQAMEAFHVEGPHISPDDGPRGAHPKRWVRAPDVDEFHRLQDAARGNVRLVTMAPEWPGATRYIEALTSQGVVVSIGHTAATPEQIRDAIQAGGISVSEPTDHPHAGERYGGVKDPCGNLWWPAMVMKPKS